MTQETALNILKTGANVFLTGEPGSGKTHTVNKYISYLREHDIQPSITASTGIAATHVGGMTIHSWGGIGISRTLSDYQLDAMSANESLVRRVTNAKVLIIDEISMLDGQLLGMIESVTRTLRHSEEPFGGLQVIFVGDFFQLPPIVKREEGRLAQFCFESPAWAKANPVVCYLTEQHRQEDATFLSTLGAIRRGELEDAVYEYLGERNVARGDHPLDIPLLYTHNIDVDLKNNEELQKIDAKEEVFLMSTKGSKNRVEQLIKGCISPEELVLKVGASVMFTKNNFEEGYVNGTLGTVEGFDEDTGYPLVRARNGKLLTAIPSDWSVADGNKVLATITQIPLRLAWAITVHKSQGMSLDAAVMDLGRAFEYGQGYVALSRVRSSSGLHLLGINQRALEVHPLVLERDESFRELSAEAEGAFEAMDESEIGTLHKNFILAMGGSLKKVSGKQKKAHKLSTHEETLLHITNGKTIDEIARSRELKTNTIFEHIEKLRAENRVALDALVHLITPKLKTALPEIHRAYRDLDTTKLTPLFEHFGGKHSFDDLRIARLFLLSDKLEK